MRVFISSTVYDLIDIRAELTQLLSDLKISPVLSDDKLSDFNLIPDANSIQTCLLNVETSNAVIVILNQRYGPRLGKCGFDDVSATHLEYRHAKKFGIPVYFYVRDRLEADYKIRNDNLTNTDIELAWTSSKDYGLFELLREHRELVASGIQSNWISLFTNSLDLKECVRRHLEPAIKPQNLINAIHENRFPLFVSEIDADRFVVGSIPSIKCCLRLKNIGLAPAFDFVFQWELEDHGPEKKEIVAPGQEINTTVLSKLAHGPELEINVNVTYRSIIGVAVRERYRVYCYLQGGPSPGMFSGASLVDRTYHNSPLPTVAISE